MYQFYRISVGKGFSPAKATQKGCPTFIVRLFIPVFVFFILTIFPENSFAFRDLGVPVKEAIIWGAHVGPGKTGERDTIYLSFGQYKAPLFLLAINPDTDEIRQFNGPLSSEMGSWGFTVDQENRIYLGSGANLWEFEIPLTPTVKQAE